MRTDLLGLSEQTLADLTNKGTVRRALKELAATAHTFSLRADGALIVEASDETRCELLADRGFADWTCTCLAARSCRHLVRAVIAYQHANQEAEPNTAIDAEAPGATQPEVAPAPADDETMASDSEPAGRAGGAAPFDPASITEDQLATLPESARRAASRLLDGGALGLVGVTNNLTVVRIQYPTPVTVRFLAGADLRYVRCTCREVDPCLHVPVAVAIARGRPFGDTGLRTIAGDTWAPERCVLSAIHTQLTELALVGVEASHRSMRGPWQRLAAQCENADLPHLAELIGELITEAAAYFERSANFDPSRIIAIVGELLARTISLGAAHPDRIPDRLVAGARVQPAEVSRGKLIGLGTEIVEAGERVRLIAYLIDARSGSPLRVSKEFDDPDFIAARELGKRFFGGIPFAHWGGGQVMAPAGKRFGNGDFTPGRGRVVAMPKADLAALSAPFLVDSIAELSTHQTRLPPALDDRCAGADLAACRFVGVQDVGFDPGGQELVATLVDATGARARLALPGTPRVELGESAELLARWAEHTPEQLTVAGRWHWSRHGATLRPLLLMGDDISLQPVFGQSSAFDTLVGQDSQSVTSPAALLRHVDELVGQALVAGLERIATDREPWQTLAGKAEGAGSSLIAGLVRQVCDDVAPAALLHLALISVLGHPIAEGT